MSTSRPLVYLLVAILTYTELLAARAVARSPVTGADVIRSLRDRRGIGVYAGHTLRQLDGPGSRAVQDDLAD